MSFRGKLIARRGNACAKITKLGCCLLNSVSTVDIHGMLVYNIGSSEPADLSTNESLPPTCGSTCGSLYCLSMSNCKNKHKLRNLRSSSQGCHWVDIPDGMQQAMPGAGWHQLPFGSFSIILVDQLQRWG